MFCCLLADASEAALPAGAIEAVARACSPRVILYGHEAAIFDVSGLARVLGPPEIIGPEVARMAATHGLGVRVVVADTMTAAWVLAHARAGVTTACGRGRAALADVPTAWLATVIELDRHAGVTGAAGPGDVVGTPKRRPARGRHYRVAPPPPGTPDIARPGPIVRAVDRERHAACLERLGTFERWGIRTCGDLAALPRADIHARMGPVGVRLHQAAHGEDVVPLAPVGEAVVFTDRVALEWPIEGLEPLAFVLARQCERLSLALERADRGAVAIHTTLTLVTRETHARTLALPAPIRDARVLRTLIGLDLESHPPPVAIDVVELTLDVTPGRILQGSLLTWAVPAPEDVSTLLARLGALVGDTRVGAPWLPDTHDQRQVGLVPFRVPEPKGHGAGSGEAPGSVGSGCGTLRRFRLPLAVRVTLEQGTPVAVWPSAGDLAGGRVVTCAGPWRSSGSWWTDDRATWDRDEWDVEVPGGVLYRLARLRVTGRWELEGIFD